MSVAIRTLKVRFLAALLPIACCACGRTVAEDANDQLKADMLQQVVGVEPPTPKGALRYCWEEPIVDYQAVNPGVDQEGKWYRPSYLSVREIRSGKWRPCRPVPNEVKGETRNER